MVRAVLEVNVLISAIINPHGFPRRVWSAWQQARFTLVTSNHIILETAAKLRLPRISRRHGLSEAELLLFEAAMSTQAVVVRLLSDDVLPVTGDPEDDAVLATARLGQSGYLVTGDHGLLSLSDYEGTKIVTPRAFWEQLDDR